jgi:tetratricopeptide (TPR) repeat protein
MKNIGKKLCLLLMPVLLLFGCKSTPETASLPPPAAPETDAAAYFSQGNDFYRQNQFDAAINAYSEALGRDSAMAEAYIARGNSYSCKSDFSRAQVDYNAGAKANAGYDHYARGYSLYLAGEYRAAIDEFSEAIAQNSNLLAAYNDRGMAYYNMRNLDRAIDDFDQAVNINPGSPFAYNNRGNAYLVKRDYGNAIQDYSRAIQLYPALVYPYSGRGQAHFRLKSYDKAIEDVSKAIAMSPEDAGLYTLRADIYAAKGEKNLADADRQTAERYF